MQGERLPGRGLTAHYFFTFGVEVQLVGDRNNTRVEQRILHLDVAAPALKLIQKGSVRIFLRFDAINQIVFDDVEPRSVLISCRDDRRYFVVFQSAEDNLVFRTACADLAAGRLDMNRFQRAVLKKGQLKKRGKAGAIFGDRYAILTPRKLYILHGKVAVFPSNAVSLEEATPRFDDARGTIHLDLAGKEYVLQGSDKEESQDWFVEIARAATSRVPILQWDDATAARMHAEQQQAEDEAEQEEMEMPAFPMRQGLSARGTNSPSLFTSPDDWQDEEEAPDHHLDASEYQDLNHNVSNNHNNNSRQLGRSQSGQQQQSQQGARGHMQQQQQQQQRQNSLGGQRGDGQGIGRGVLGSFSGSGGSYVDAAGNVIKLGSGAARPLGSSGSSSGSGSGSGSGSRGLRRTWSGASSSRGGVAAAPHLQQQRPHSYAGGSGSGGSPERRGIYAASDTLSNASTPRSNHGHSSNGVPRYQQQQQQQQQQEGEEEEEYLDEAEEAAAMVGTLGTIYEAAEGSNLDTTQPNTSADDGGVISAEDYAEDAQAAQPQLQQQQQQQQVAAARRVVPPAPPLRLSKLQARASPQQQQQQRSAPTVAAARRPSVNSSSTLVSQCNSGNGSRRASPAAAIAAEAARLAANRASRQQQQQQQASSDEFFADFDADDELTPEEEGDELSAEEQEQAAAAAGHLHARSPSPAYDHNAARSGSGGGSRSRSPVSLGRRGGASRGLSNPAAATAGFMSPGAAVDLEALTEAVTGRIAQHASLRSTQQQQQSVLGPLPVAGSLSGVQYHHGSPVQGQLYPPPSQQQQQQYPQQPYAYSPVPGMNSPYGMPAPNMPYGNASPGLASVGLYYPPQSPATAAAGMAPGAAAAYLQQYPGMPFPNSNSSMSGSPPQQQQQQLPSGSPYCQANQYYAASPIAGSSGTSGAFGMQHNTAGLTSTAFTSTDSPRRTVNWGSGPGVISSSGSGSGARQADSSSGWGRKSLAGLYSTGKQRSAAAAAAAAAAGASGNGSSILAAGRTSLLPDGGNAAARSSMIAAAAAAAAGGSRPGTATAGPAGSSSGTVEHSEYIIPSVMRVIVGCPEGVELAARLRGQQDLTPHQCCLALMRWAFGVYAQLPEEARTAIPAGPSRHNLKTWVTPDLQGLMGSIFQAQTMHQQQQQHTDWLLQQQQQSGRQSPGLPWQQQQQLPQDVVSAAAALLAALNAAGTTSAPWQQLLGSAAGFNPLLLNPSLLSLLSGLGGQQYAQGAALQQLLAALAAAAAPATAANPAGVPHAAAAAGSSTATAGGLASPKQQSHQQRHKHKSGSSSAMPQQRCSRCHRSYQPLADEKVGAGGCNGAVNAADNVGQQAARQQQHLQRIISTSSSSSTACSSDADGDTCGYCQLQVSQQQQQQRKAGVSHSGICALMNPNLNITVRLKESQLPAAAAAPGSQHSDAAAAAAVAPKQRSHRLHGRCSFTCDNPLFQLDHRAAGAAAAAAVSVPPEQRRRPSSAAAMDRHWDDQQQQQQQQLLRDGQVLLTAVRAGGGSSSSSARSSSDSISYHLAGRGGSCSSSTPLRCSAACFLSAAAAETICQAASTAAAAAAAAVRSAVLSIDAGEAGDAPCYAGRPSCVPHSIESLVSRVQAGELDAAGFVEAVAAGRAGPLLRPAASLC